MKKKGLSKTAKVILTIIIIVAVCAIGFCAYKIISINKSYSDTAKYYDNIEKLVTSGKTAGNGTDSSRPAEESADNSTENETEKTINGVSVEEMYEENELPAGYGSSVTETSYSETEYNAPVDQNAADTLQEEQEMGYADAAGQTSEYTGTESQNSAAAEAAGVRVKRETGYGYSLSPLMKRRHKLSDYFTKHASIDFDYNAFHELCEDAEGYIYQEGTLSYPVVQAEDNDKYLRHLIDGSYNVAGTIFVDCNYEDGLDSQYAVVYGHNMDDKSMFGSITSYKNKEYYDDHPYFEIYTKSGKYVYYVYAAGQIPLDSYVFTAGMNDEEFLETMDRIRDELRPYEMDPPVHINKLSKVLVLSTCIDYPRDYNYRYVVVIVRGEPLLDKIDTEEK